MSPDGRALVLARVSQARELYLESLHLETDEYTELLTVPGVMLHNPAFSPDGTKMAFMMTTLRATTSNCRVANSTIAVMDVGSGTWAPVITLTTAGGRIEWPTADDLYFFLYQPKRCESWPGFNISPPEVWRLRASDWTAQHVFALESTLAWSVTSIEADGPRLLANQPEPIWIDLVTGAREPLLTSHPNTEVATMNPERACTSLDGSHIGFGTETEHYPAEYHVVSWNQDTNQVTTAPGRFDFHSACYFSSVGAMIIHTDLGREEKARLFLWTPGGPGPREL